MSIGRRVSRQPCPDLRKKLVIVGDGTIGKTCLLLVFANGSFPGKYVPTVFENFLAKIKVDGKKIELALWDTAGQEEYDRLRSLSYPDSDIILIAFDVISPATLHNVKERWYPEISHFASDSPILLVGLKSDLRDHLPTLRKLEKEGQTPITQQEALKVAKSIKAVKYMECSAKSRVGVDEVFYCACRILISTPLRKIHQRFCSPL